MMTQQLEVSILAAPLQAIDRRVLSQAWYAALRMGAPAPVRATSGPPAPADGPQIAAQHSTPAAGRFDAARSGSALPVRRHCGHAARSPVDAECRRPRDARASRRPLARAIETAFGGAPLRRATFSVGRGRARIHVVLQTKGNQTTLIALCPPHMAEAVAQALAQARVALAARRIAVDLRAQGVRRCF